MLNLSVILFFIMFLSTTYNKNFLNFGLLLLRIVIGLSMLSHGYPKLQMLMSGKIEFMSLWGLSPGFTLAMVVFAEFLCPFFIIIGLFTRLACIPIMFTMLFAIFMVHIQDDFSKMELPILYFLSYLMLLILSAGKFSVDAMIEKRRYEW
ncbi:MULTISPECIES: DoxX family protein [Amniculibacterium]|uniref:DoxX family protein n=1 Tax=Amniculibacterium TaxID=2715289 RepID=UPI001F154C67|nr:MULTISPECIES: DoxX family protein [Amniculibacterium]